MNEEIETSDAPEQMMDFELELMQQARTDLAVAAISDTAREFPTVPLYFLIELASEEYDVDAAELSHKIRESDRKMWCPRPILKKCSRW
jgi:hypothetical protein